MVHERVLGGVHVEEGRGYNRKYFCWFLKLFFAFWVNRPRGNRFPQKLGFDPSSSSYEGQKAKKQSVEIFALLFLCDYF
jgi:hypothetical protein